MAFDHLPFPLMVERATSSLEFSTTIIPTGSGAEQRIGNWLDARIVFNAGMGVRSRADIITLVRFFRARKGRLRGFLVKDLLDHTATGDAIGVGNGSNKVFQLQRVYSDSNVTGGTPYGDSTYGITGNTDNRPIYKPIAGTLSIYLDSVLQTQGGYGGYGDAAITTDALNNPVITAGGSGYTSVPGVVFTGGGGTGAAGTAVLTAQVLTSITMTSRGTGYTSAPVISFTGGGGGTGAAATVGLTGRVSSLTLTGDGTGYSSAPTVTIVSGGGSGATATASVSGGKITTLNLTNGGFGYTSVPTVNIVSSTGDCSVNYKTGVVTFATAPPTDDVVSWSGQFYVPCRFAEDTLPADEIFYDYLESLAAGGIPDILLLETRDYQ